MPPKPQPVNNFSQFYDALLKGDGSVVEQPTRNPIRRWALGREMDRIVKAVGRRALEQQDEIRSRPQDAVVSDSLRMLGLYDTPDGVRDKVGTTFNALRNFAADIEPINACIETQVRKVSNFAQVPDVSMGQFQTPGLKIVMTNHDDEATTEDKRNIAALTHFLLECGHAAPPRDEIPDNWQPGFEPFLQQVVRDRLTLGWATVRRWHPTRDSDSDWPIAAFAATDAALIRRVRRNPVGLVNGRILTDPFPSERTNTRAEIKFVRIEQEDANDVPDQYTADEMFAVVGMPRTDERTNGYGIGEVEDCIEAGNGWAFGRDYNMSRFRMDGLPRGILTILADVAGQSFDAFQMEWMQMFKGNAKRWNLPMLQGKPQAGSGVIWTPLDMNSRDSEYHQWMFLTAALVHSRFGIHPEETGYGSVNPYRPPLSEASPEVKIEHSQNSSFQPLMRWIAGWINREIIWRIYPDRRYSFRWVGIGEIDFMASIQFWTAALEAGATTPRLMWAAMDQPIPAAWKDHPAVDLPMPFAQGVELVMSMEQQQQQQEQAEQQQQAQAQMAQQQAAQQGQQMAGPTGGAPGLPQGQPGQPIPAPSPAQPQNPAGAVSGGPQRTPGGGQPMWSEKAIRTGKHHGGMKVPRHLVQVTNIPTAIVEGRRVVIR